MRAMQTARIGIFGGSGYAGTELTRLLLGHPGAQVAFVASERKVGQSVARELGLPTSTTGLMFVGFEAARAMACDVVMLATPAEASLQLAPECLARGTRVVDLSGAFRLSDAASFRKHYQLDSPSTELQSQAVYGLPELSRERIAGARLVANPGCYPTAAILGLAPLLRAGLIDPSTIIVDAASGVTGAGRKASEEYSLAELTGDFKAYKVLRHQHTPEIAQALENAGGRAPRVTFTPHLLPVPRGILCTSYARLMQPLASADVAACLARAYAGEPFIDLAEHPDRVGLRQVVGTNQCQLAAASDPESGQVVVVSAIDNLVKGAAGQALQNLNLMLGWPETTGLTTLRRFTP
jgi:N-acetyl-gamma-glutamyl-phosphate reductase